MKIHIKNGHLVDPHNGVDAAQDIYIAAGRVVAVGGAPDGFEANRTIDATGLLVCPGLVDLSARLREPGLEYRATLESEMQAAVAGGVTHLLCPPDTDPPLDEPGLVEMLKHRARQLHRAHVWPLGALTEGLRGERLTEMVELRDAGCVAFSQANQTPSDTRMLLRAMQYAATFGFSVWLQPQDAYLARDGVAHEGEIASRLGLAGIPVAAETIALGKIMELVRLTGCRVHLRRLSSANGLAMVAHAKAEGLPLTCDISVNHLHLSEHDIGFFDSHCHLIPPLRSHADRAALAAGLADGTIDALCSDHTPVDDDAKQLPFEESEAGATGLELLLPLTLKWAREARLPLATAISRVTANPAQVAGLDAGHLGVGAAADLCLIAPETPWRVSRDSLCSQGKNTPFLGWELEGQVQATFVDGQAVFQLKEGQT